MISWIQEVLIKNGKVIFSLLLIVIIFAFVIAFTPGQGGFGGEKVRSEVGFFGYNIVSPEVMRQQQSHLLLSMQLNDQNQRIPAEQFQAMLYQRLSFLHYADVMAVPEPLEADVQEFLREQPAFSDENGAFEPAALASFLDSLEINPELNQDVLFNTLVEDYRIERLQEALGGPGFALAFEASQMGAFQRTRYTADMVTVDLSDFKPEIDASEDNLRAFYDENPRRYETPEHIEVVMVKFNQSDFRDQAGQPTEAEIKAWWERSKRRFYRPAATPGEKPEEPSLEDHRDEAILGAQDEKGKPFALSAAEEFAYQLYRNPAALGSDSFNALVEKHRGKVIDVPAFPQNRAPYSGGVSNREMAKAFELNEDSPFSQIPVEANNGAAILIYKGMQPPAIPPYEEVAERVKTDYESDMREAALQALGESIKKQISEAVAAGKSFAEAAEAVTDAKLSVQRYENFGIMETPEGFDRSLAFSLMNMNAGEFTDLTTRDNEGSLMHLATKTVTPPDFASEEFKTLLDRIKEQNAYGGAAAIISEQMELELIRAGVLSESEEEPDSANEG